jgi:phenylalanyl-tRNA synthetase beta chain
MPQPAPVRLRVARAAKVLGMTVTQAQCVQALQRLGLPVAESDGVVTVQPPRYRFDLQLEEDLIEEVARLIGYDALPDSAPLAPIVPCVRPEHERSTFALRRSLAALGYQETINFSFVDERGEYDLCGNPNPLRLLNPIASQMGEMRSSLLPSLLQLLRYNLNRRATRVRVFEFGRVFLRDAQVADSLGSVAGVHQPMRLAALAHGPVSPLQWGERERAADFFDLKGDLECLLTPVALQLQAAQHPAMHPGRCARVLLNGRDVGLMGELHPRWVQELELGQAPVLFEVELDAVLRRGVPAFGGVPKFQAMERDLAVVVDESVSSDALVAAAREANTGSLLRDVLLFDLYRAKDGSMAGRKSVALRLTLGSDTATLSDEQGEACVQAVLQNLQSRLGAQLRA